MTENKNTYNKPKTGYLGKNPRPNYQGNKQPYTERKTKWGRPLHYTFMNQGTAYSFDPYRRTNWNGNLTTFLELHKEEVRLRNSPDCFILTDSGIVLKI